MLCMSAEINITLLSLSILFSGEWKKKLESFSGWFQKEKFVVTNERLRLSKKTSSEGSDTFGSEGAFRKLAID